MKFVILHNLISDFKHVSESSGIFRKGTAHQLVCQGQTQCFFILIPMNVNKGLFALLVITL